MGRWRFVETDGDGELWLQYPGHVTACVEFEAQDARGETLTFRAMVVTRGWLEKHLQGVRESSGGPLWAGVPSLIVVPDAAGDDLRMIVDRVMSEEGLQEYSTRVQ